MLAFSVVVTYGLRVVTEFMVRQAQLATMLAFSVVPGRIS
jgi:hypothetical protein